MKTFAPLSALALLSLTHVAWAAPVSIQVLGPDKKPVPGAQVRASFWKSTMSPLAMEAGDVQSAVSDAKGLARFESPEAGGVDWMNGMIGSAVAWSPTLSVSSSILRVGQNTIALARSGTARGVVVDGAGQPLAGATVRLSGVTPAEASIMMRGLPAIDSKMVSEEFVARSDDKGAWRLEGLPLLGSVSVELGDDKFARTSASAPVAEDGAPWSADDSLRAARAKAAAPVARVAPTFNPMRREASGDGILVARAGASIAGRVLDAIGAPVEGASISATLPGQDLMPHAGEPEKTDARGEFRVGRLSEGEYKIGVVPLPKDQARGVLGAPLKVAVVAGASVALGEVKLVPGGTVTVRMLDAGTGRGISGGRAVAMRGSFLNGVPEFVMSPPSDASGQSVLHLPAGKYQVGLAEPPQGYLTPQGMNFAEGEKIEAVVGADKAVEWKLTRGLSLRGRTVDEKGQPVPNVNVLFLPSANTWSGRTRATSDAGGQWSLSAFGAGAWKVVLQSDEWKLASPANVSLPRVEPLDIVLAPIARVSITGRAVDGVGAPLAGARVDLKITVEQESFTVSERSATTGADGTWRIETVPETASAITVGVSRAGYAPQRLPKTSKADGAWAATQAILQKRDSRLAGRVLDGAGQAAPAQVLVASTQSLVASDKQGAWSASDLPSGEVEVIAVGAGGSSVATTIAPNEGMTLRLKAPPTLAARDVERASEVLEDAWQTSRGAQIGSRAFIPAVLAAADPDAALALARGGDKKELGRVVLEIVRVMLRQGAKGAEEAEAWAQANMGAVEEPFERTALHILLAQSLADSDAASARKWLGQARASFAEFKEEGFRRQHLATQLAAIGGKLKEADAEALFEQALKLALGNTGSSSFDTLAWQVAPVSEARAVKVIEAAIVAAPTQPRYSQGPVTVAASAIRRLARTDLPAAKRLLAKYGSLKSELVGFEMDMDSARAEVLGARAKAGEDVDALAREAADLQRSAQALALIADNALGAKKVELLKRALEVAQQSRLGMSESLQVIRRLLPLDREASRAALEKGRLELEAPREDAYEWNRLRAADVAGWAWLYRNFDAVAARLMIEREWAIGASALPGERDESNRWPRMAELVTAMMPLDIERAQQLAERLPVAGGNAPAFGAQRTLARWMLAEEKERAEKPFRFWSRDREDDGRDSNEW